MYEDAENEDLAIDKVLSETTCYAVEKYKIDAFGTGVSFPNGDLKGLGLAFQIDHQFSKDDVKRIVLDIGNFMKAKANESQVLVKCMENPPFTLNNITVDLFFTDERGYVPVHPKYVVVSLSNGEFITKTKESRDSFKYFCVTSEKVEVD